MAERNFTGLRDTISARLISQRSRHKDTKDRLYELIDESKTDEFFRKMKSIHSYDRVFYKLVLFYGVGPPSDIQSLWIKLMKCNRIPWMKMLESKQLMSNLQPVMLCLSNNTPISSLNCAIEMQNAPIVKFLLELQCRNFGGRFELPSFRPSLIKCVNHWNLDIAKILAENNVDINQTTKSGNTALHFAAENQEFQAVNFLIEHRADVNIQNSKGKTPLHLAVNTESKNIVKKLLDAGAILSKDKFNHTPLFYAVLYDNKRSEPALIPDFRYHKRRQVITQPNINMAKELCQISELLISDILSMLSMSLVPLHHDTDRYNYSIRQSMVSHVKHGIKPVLHSQFLKYPEAKNVAQAEKVHENPILQVLYSSTVWMSAQRTNINNSTMRSRLLLYLTILLNSSSLEQCFRRPLRYLISLSFQCFLQPFPPTPKHTSTDVHINKILRQAWKEFTCLIMLTQHLDMPVKQMYLDRLESYLNEIIIPIFRRVEKVEDIASLFLSLELICIPIHLFLYLWWQTTHSPSDHYFKSFERIQNYIHYFYPYYLIRHDILTAIVSITCYDSHKLVLNADLHHSVGHELGNFAMIQNNTFDVKMTDMIDFLVDLQIDMNFRSPITGNAGLHVAAKEVLSNELIHLLNVGTYPLTLDRSGNTFYQYAHDNPNSFQEEERKLILSHPSIEGLAPPKLETLCALIITKNTDLCQYALDYLPNTRYSKLIYLNLRPNFY
ncbi:Ankyrin repeat protein [Oopsacas minuta]|uniref:Ankyrin repeat protein n=1 Tax=Oopsacas minuta TaxID=111878 RepID=A0AAV7JHB7_9METZ|nr:Ankyrin repeat protein [Oopsacas minuta]